eukprot:922648_1
MAHLRHFVLNDPVIDVQCWYQKRHRCMWGEQGSKCRFKHMRIVNLDLQKIENRLNEINQWIQTISATQQQLLSFLTHQQSPQVYASIAPEPAASETPHIPQHNPHNSPRPSRSNSRNKRGKSRSKRSQNAPSYSSSDDDDDPQSKPQQLSHPK